MRHAFGVIYQNTRTSLHAGPFEHATQVQCSQMKKVSLNFTALKLKQMAMGRIFAIKLKDLAVGCRLRECPFLFEYVATCPLRLPSGWVDTINLETLLMRLEQK